MSANYSTIEKRAREAAAAALAAGRGEAVAARAAIAAAEDFLATIAVLGLGDALAKLACGSGCASCCHQMVGVTRAELAVIKDAVAALPPAVQAGIAARVAEVAAQAKGLDPAGWWKAKLPCPLLDDAQACLVHQARPLPCRAMNSADADICRRSLAGEKIRIPVLAAQHGIMGHAQAGLAQALAKAGHDHRPVALGVALA